MGTHNLGFVSQASYMLAPNSQLIGSSGHPSKKGPHHPAQSSILHERIKKDDRGESSSIPSKESLLTKRCDWLEQQERKTTATLSDTRTTQRDLQEQMQSRLGDMSQEQGKISAVLHEERDKGIELFNETQWVYGKALAPIRASLCARENWKDSLRHYRKTHEPSETLAKNEWYLFIYPMEKVFITPEHYQLVMRCKQVDKSTGQLSLLWAVVYESFDGKDTRFVSEFSLKAC